MLKYFIPLLFLIIGCGECLKHGKITGREIVPASTTLIFQQVGDIQIPIIIDNPERYVIKIDGKLSNGDMVKQSFNVSKYEYEHLKDGEEYIPE